MYLTSTSKPIVRMHADEEDSSYDFDVCLRKKGPHRAYFYYYLCAILYNHALSRGYFLQRNQSVSQPRRAVSIPLPPKQSQALVSTAVVEIFSQQLEEEEVAS